MKFVHLSDFHLGKRVNEYSLFEDQKYIIDEIIKIIDSQNPDAVLIAGDVFDKSIPSVDAVELFDDFLVRLSERKLQVFIISGNHDSSERLAFGGRIFGVNGIHISPTFSSEILPITLNDEFGTINIFMLPFIKPVQVRRYFDDDNIVSYTDAMACVIKKMNLDKNERNILITHQFVTGACRSDSEEISVGGSDNVDKEVFKDFDYVALGHIHGPQNIGTEKIRYSGTPLKYSFSEASHKKSVTIVELKEKGSLHLTEIPLVPLRDMVELRGMYDELVSKSFYANTTYQNDFVHITLTDEEDIIDAVGKLRTIYPNLMKLDYDNNRTRLNQEVISMESVEEKSPFEMFAELFELQNNKEMTNEQQDFMKELIEKVWEEK